MIKLTLTALLLCSPIFAQDPGFGDEVMPCRFVAHTAAGTVSGDCTAQDLPTRGFNTRWKFTLMFDAKTDQVARQLKPDQFCDLVRAQSTEDGTDRVVLSLWGDLEVVYTDPEYSDKIKETAPIYETRPNVITISQTGDSPYTLDLLFEEPAEYFDLVSRTPSPEWWSKYLEGFYRLGTNRANGFSIDTAALPVVRRTQSAGATH